MSAHEAELVSLMIGQHLFDHKTMHITSRSIRTMNPLTAMIMPYTPIVELFYGKVCKTNYNWNPSKPEESAGLCSECGHSKGNHAGLI